MTTGEKVAFVKGLVEGAELKLGENEKKVLDNVLEILGELAEDVSCLHDDVDELFQTTDDLSEALDYLGDVVFEDIDDEDYDDDPMYEVECANCHQIIHLDEEAICSGDVSCPNCGEKLEFDLECECDDEDCDCHHNH